LESLLGRPVFASLPKEYSRLLQSYSECRLLKKGVLSEEFNRLAGRMIGQEREKAAAGLPEWLSGLGMFGRKVLQ